MAGQAVDFQKYRLRRENRKLIARVVALPDKNLQWRLDGTTRAFLRDSRMGVADLTNVLTTAQKVRAGGAPNELFVDGYSVDDVLVRLQVLDDSNMQPPSLTCLGGKLITDEEDLVG